VLQELDPVCPDISVQHLSNKMAVVLKNIEFFFAESEKDFIREAVNILMVLRRVIVLTLV